MPLWSDGKYFPLTYSREAVEKILAHPLFDEGRALAESDAVLVSLTAGKDLTMAEVNRVMEQIKRQCSRAQIIMGAAMDADFKNRLCVTVIAAKPNAAAGNGAGVTARSESGTVVSTSSTRRGTPVDGGPRKRATIKKPVQTQLPFTIVSKGRFDKSEPTLHRGEDLDVPTFIRRGIALNLGIQGYMAFASPSIWPEANLTTLNGSIMVFAWLNTP